jgi:hypothetical protein
MQLTEGQLEAYKAAYRRRVAPCFEHVAQLAIVDASKPTIQEQFVGSATATLIRTSQAAMVVTCAHVYAAYEDLRSESDSAMLLLLGEGGTRPLDLSDARLIASGGKTVDLASIEAPKGFEASTLQKQFIELASHPSRPEVGELAIAFGMPTQMRLFSRNAVSPKRFNVGGSISAVSDRHISIADENKERDHLRGENSFVLSDEIDLGGLSGGAVYVFDEHLRNPRLVGFVYETTNGLHAHLKVVHADFLKLDGTLDNGLICW